ncbi:hypothetical protein [Amycolatopsis sp. NPDC006125]|uniref:hypothetical protein n=1 Tax=Amycolatopsis sp. NPDC006125 TaxID=3156730 RepID=UPI0033BA8953
MSVVNPRPRHNLLRLAVEGSVLVTAFTVAMTVMIDLADWPRSPALLGAVFSAISWQGVFKIIGHQRMLRRTKKLHFETRRKITTEIEDQMQELTDEVREDLRRLTAEFREELHRMRTLTDRGNLWAQAFADSEVPAQTGTSNVARLRPVEN